MLRAQTVREKKQYIEKNSSGKQDGWFLHFYLKCSAGVGDEVMESPWLERFYVPCRNKTILQPF